MSHHVRDVLRLKNDDFYPIDPLIFYLFIILFIYYFGSIINYHSLGCGRDETHNNIPPRTYIFFTQNLSLECSPT